MLYRYLSFKEILRMRKREKRIIVGSYECYRKGCDYVLTLLTLSSLIKLQLQIDWRKQILT